MTREECIKWLKSLKTEIGKSEYGALWHYAKAIDMAIEALSAGESVTLYAIPKATYIRPLTEEIAIKFLQDSGWLPNHDKKIESPSMLVRCKDCLMTKERDKYTGNLWCCRHREYMDDMYYCADGLRREEDDE